MTFDARSGQCDANVVLHHQEGHEQVPDDGPYPTAWFHVNISDLMSPGYQWQRPQS